MSNAFHIKTHAIINYYSFLTTHTPPSILWGRYSSSFSFFPSCLKHIIFSSTTGTHKGLGAWGFHTSLTSRLHSFFTMPCLGLFLSSFFTCSSHSRTLALGARLGVMHLHWASSTVAWPGRRLSREERRRMPWYGVGKGVATAGSNFAMSSQPCLLPLLPSSCFQPRHAQPRHCLATWPFCQVFLPVHV